MSIGTPSQTVGSQLRAALRRIAPDDVARNASAVVLEDAGNRRTDRVRGADGTASCTDASGNYVGEGPDTALDAYIGVESLAGHLLCPGCRRHISPIPVYADPARVAGLVFFGTSDENLYVRPPSEVQTADARVVDPVVESTNAAPSGSDWLAFVRRRRTPAEQF